MGSRSVWRAARNARLIAAALLALSMAGTGPLAAPAEELDPERVDSMPALCAYVTHSPAGGVSVLDIGRREWRGFIPVSKPVDVALRPDGRRAYVTRDADIGINGSVAVIDTATGAVSEVLRLSRGEPAFIAASPDGAFALVTLWSDEYRLARLDTTTEALVNLLPLAGDPPRRQERAFAVAISPDGALAYVTNHYARAVLSNQIDAIETAAGSVIASLPFATQPRWVAFAADGRRAFATLHGPTANDPSSLLQLDTATHTATPLAVFPDGAESVAVAPDGGAIYVSHPHGDRVSVIDPNSGGVRTVIASASFPYTVTFTPDGATAVVGNVVSHTLTLIDTASELVTATIDLPYRPERVAVASVPGGCVAPPLPPTPTATTPPPDDTPTPTLTPARFCAGDCNRDGRVSIEELLRGVAIAAGEAPLAACRDVDADGSKTVTIGELIGATRNALLGCGGSLTPALSRE